MHTLLELAERAEKATGPDRELDAAIGVAIGLPTIDRTGERGFHGLYFVGGLSAYTASLDAALTLLPEDSFHNAVFWRVGNDGEGGNPEDFKAQVLVSGILASFNGVAVATTAPLALCAAALRARASVDTHPDRGGDEAQTSAPFMGGATRSDSEGGRP